jgi:putative 4-mercaptohistidine N1-methyltranferase
MMESLYESPRLLDEYLLFHYGRASDVLPWEFGPAEALDFPVRTVTELAGAGSRDRALDLGCAVGRSTFELSRFCGHVTGIDYSRNFISAAETLRRSGRLPYNIREEGTTSRALVAVVPDGCHPDRVVFEQGDAMSLREDIGDFDLVHAANLLCRLADPERLLLRLPPLVRPDGTLTLTTPCTWLEEFTPPARWPATGTFEWLKRGLSAHFELLRTVNLPFLIREHARKFQWSVALATVWKRRS